MLNIKKKIAMAATTTVLGAMLIGVGTFAWFTSAATNEGNSFKSGTVVINLDKPNGNKYFEIDNMAPGDSGQATVKVTNDGSLELRYDIAETLTGDLAAAPDGLIVTIEDSTGNIIKPGDNNRVLAANGGSEDLTVKYELPTAAGNAYQDKGATLDLAVNAEQTKNN